ncbi:hypothetical protein EG240_03620 [Paenimyroides tangerinum]|uniref:Peptidase M48 domain-containing protein n=1 Tax=Paenimyroides tangerinum TaxID=2488728 RepID=A0A3P3WDX9_9FLAO|nr:M48 family metalloprotease [Paenimyroides tangerinum]RRJ92276.1 hypothetical protein EG240_03620 [Paenimyroides tangerinum]
MEIQISPGFKKQAQRAILSIVLFIVSFILLTLLGLAVVAFFVFLAFKILIFMGNFIGMLLAVGLVGSAIVLLIFLFKFIFQKSSNSTEGMHQIYTSQHPKFFKMIHEIADEVGTDFPKKVFLTDQLNASVFYDSSFWSMIFPVRKNLMIGYALVNVSTEQELKGILAHEFGHFSQRSMKIGSYVYNCNRIIFSLVFENSSFEENVNKFSNGHILFKLTVGFSIYIIRGFQFVLKQFYIFLNKSNLSLSREMEFHADAVATNIVGSQVMIDSLARMDLSDRAYGSANAFTNSKYSEGFRLCNFYDVQTYVLNIIARKDKHNFNEHLPKVTLDELRLQNKSRLNIKDQWASHPTMEERIESIQRLNIQTVNNSLEPAKFLFEKPNEIELKLTKLIYPEHELTDLKELSSTEEKDMYDDFLKSVSFNEIYNGYYDNKNPLTEISKVIDVDSSVTLKSLFSDEEVALGAKYLSLNQDYKDVEYLAFQKHKIKTFDFDGIKYRKKNAENLLKNLDKELLDLKNQIESHDDLIYSFFYHKAQDKGLFLEWDSIYKTYITMDKLYDLGYKKAVKFEEVLVFMNKQSSIPVIQENLKIMKPFEEVFKTHLKELVATDLFQNDINEERRKLIINYIDNDEAYLRNEQWNDPALNLLFDCLRNISYIHSDLIFTAKKNLLDFQANQLK